MKINSRYSKSFYSYELSDTKYHEIYDFACYLNGIKNELSIEVNKNLLYFHNMSKYEFQQSILPLVRDRIHSNFYRHMTDDVFVAYQNKFNAIKKKLNFKMVQDYHFIYYKRNSKKHSIGELKEIHKKFVSTPLTITLTYLARYGNNDILDYLLERFVSETNHEKELFYASIIDHIYKYGLSRLMKLAISKRQRIIKRYSENPIVFSSLTFRGRSRLTADILSYNKNFNSKIKAFINISWGNNDRKKLTIPVKYSKDFHKDMKRYTNGTDTSYTLCFDENNRIRIILSYEGERDIPDNKTNFIGIDVNSKHNLMQCSNGESIDYDRKLVETLSNELLKVDSLKSNKDYVIGKRKAHKIKHLTNELRSTIRYEISSLCKKLKSINIDHAVLEDLNGFEDKCFCKDENGLNYNRRIKLLKLSSIKDEFEHIARKYGIAVSLVHSCYTSQQCLMCGCIDKNNRKTQEEFECIECGYKSNADLNASRNILKRVVSTVLRNKLLKNSKLGNGTFEPKLLNRHRVKEVLLSLRYNISTIGEEAMNST